MIPKSDQTRILPLERDEGGAKLEPEERPAERVISGGIPVSVGSGVDLDGSHQINAEMPGQISIARTAGEIAGEYRSMCSGCIHFDREGWAKYRAVLKARGFTGAREEKEISEQLRMGGLSSGEEDDPVMTTLGICRVITEMTNEVQINYPGTSCPEGVDAFSPVGGEIGKIQTEMYDRIMRLALGRRGK